MTAQATRAFVLRWLNAVSAGNSREFEDLVAPEVSDSNAGSSSTAQAFEDRARAVQDAFADLHAELDELLIDGDRIAWRWRLTGTHRAPFLGEPASGRRVTIYGVNFQRLSNGRVTEHYTLVDAPRLLAQIRGTT